ncbi:hypothetical protein D9613_012016 [Agrocybe pediades]|uniref:TEA domain-containing protein n=1 Tax=Agrocybe pediades TaxID=84607 RepID=A0A8H4VJ19_9AGAR|nr:hypothetical protein D9613_012016 [Agrocybe pediades]
MHDSTFGNGLSIPANLVSQSDKTGRRSHKMMTVAGRPRKEPVWPPALEEALLEALTIYRPVSKTGRPLRRFTKRNCFISTHIYQKTGKRRTPKQVGSRLQQISESSSNAELKRLITNRDFDNRSPPPSANESASPTSSRSSSTCLNTSDEYTLGSFSDQDSSSEHILSPLFEQPQPLSNPLIHTPPMCSPTFAHDDYAELSRYEDKSADSIALLVELVSSEAASGSSAQLGLDADITDNGINFIVSLESNENQGSYNSFYNARRLSNIPSQSLLYQVPQMAVVSPFLQPEVAYQFSYSVYLDGSTLIHTENATVLSSEATSDYPSGTRIFSTPLLPVYWSKLSKSPTLGRYTVMLDISEAPLNRASFVSQLKPKFSVALNFKSDTSDELPEAQSFYSNATVDEAPLTAGGISACMPLGNAPSLASNAGILSASQYTWFDPSGSYYPLLGDTCSSMASMHDSIDAVAPYTFAQY